MKRVLCALLALMLLTACAPKPYSPAGEMTGDAALDEQVLSVLQQTCQAKSSLPDNVRAVYDWVANEIQYRASTADTSNGFTDENVNSGSNGGYGSNGGSGGIDDFFSEFFG